MIGYGFCGSFCTLSRGFLGMEQLIAEGRSILPLMSEAVYSTDTRFGRAEDWREKVTAATGEEIVQAIIDFREKPDAAAADAAFFKEEDYGSFKDFSDLQSRIQEKTGNDIGNEASSYLIYAPETYFEITIVGASAGISHTVKAVAMVQDSKVRYIRWQEDP